jgi:hypothetical protein
MQICEKLPGSSHPKCNPDWEKSWKVTGPDEKAMMEFIAPTLSRFFALNTIPRHRLEKQSTIFSRHFSFPAHPKFARLACRLFWSH